MTSESARVGDFSPHVLFTDKKEIESVTSQLL